MRVAPTFLRFGSFEIFLPTDSQTGRPGSSNGLKDQMMPPMLDYIIENFYQEINAAFNSQEERYEAMFEEVCKRTAAMVAKWQLVGFCHGVLNTDNMSILGLTIDYGPFGFLDHFDPKHICNHSDDSGRYRYEAQPEICLWNLIKLAEALNPIVKLEKSKKAAESIFWDVYNKEYQSLLNQKLGLVDPSFGLDLWVQTTETNAIKDQFWKLLQKYGNDFTNTF